MNSKDLKVKFKELFSNLVFYYYCRTMSDGASCSRREISGIKYISSRKGGLVLLRAGHSYHKKRTYKNGGSNWHCVNRPACKGTLTINGDAIVKESHHECAPDFENNEIKTVLDICKNKAATEAIKSVHEIYENEVINYKDGGFQLIKKFPEYKNVRRGLYNSRKKAYGVKKIRNRKSTDLEIPKKFENFLFCDFNDGSGRIIVFATKECSRQLEKCKNVYVDGTFKFVVQPFLQLFSIHGDLGSDIHSNNIVPLAYALLPDKKGKTYKRLFDMMKCRLPDWQPDQFHLDFEMAIINAISEIFPSTTILGCFFHFAQALKKKAKELNLLKRRYTKRHVDLCKTLSLIPQEMKDDGWLYIMEDSPSDSETLKFNNYFVEQWLENKSVKGMCNFYGQQNRTNNKVEGWHSRLNRNLSGKTSPNILKFCEILLKESKLVELRIENVKSGVKIKNRKKEFIERDERINYIMAKLLNGEIGLNLCLEKLCAYI